MHNIISQRKIILKPPEIESARDTDFSLLKYTENVEISRVFIEAVEHRTKQK